MKYFISDIHLRHKNILKFTKRGDKKGVECLQTMQDVLIEEWNSVVKPGDVVYCLGDNNFGKPNHFVKFLDSVNGTKIVLKGNHDSSAAIRKYGECDGVTSVNSPYYECRDDNTKLVLCHYPLQAWNREHHGAIHLFGHCHNNLPEEHHHGKSMDVGLDALWENYGIFRPISLDEVLEIMENKPIEPLDGHK